MLRFPDGSLDEDALLHDARTPRDRTPAMPVSGIWWSDVRARWCPYFDVEAIFWVACNLPHDPSCRDDLFVKADQPLRDVYRGLNVGFGAGPPSLLNWHAHGPYRSHSGSWGGRPWPGRGMIGTRHLTRRTPHACAQRAQHSCGRAVGTGSMVA